MYAVIETLGKQHLVSPGTKIKIDFINNAKKGDQLTINKILMLSSTKYKIGTPYLKNAYVKATISDTGKNNLGIKNKKIYVFKKKRRHGYHKKIGHRQKFIEITINSIVY